LKEAVSTIDQPERQEGHFLEEMQFGFDTLLNPAAHAVKAVVVMR